MAERHKIFTIEYLTRREFMSKLQTKKGLLMESELKRYMVQRHIGGLEPLRTLTTVGSNKTMAKYFDDPDKMPIGTINEIMNALKIPKEERIRIVSQLIEY